MIVILILNIITEELKWIDETRYIVVTLPTISAAFFFFSSAFSKLWPLKLPRALNVQYLSAACLWICVSDYVRASLVIGHARSGVVTSPPPKPAGARSGFFKAVVLLSRRQSGTQRWADGGEKRPLRCVKTTLMDLFGFSVVDVETLSWRGRPKTSKLRTEYKFFVEFGL